MASWTYSSTTTAGSGSGDGRVLKMLNREVVSSSTPFILMSTYTTVSSLVHASPLHAVLDILRFPISVPKTFRHFD